MLISGIEKLTLLDFPHHTACIVFTAGCNFRCTYCYNPEFVLPELIHKIKHSFIQPETFFNFLKQRKGKLDGVVITGGEPTLMPDLEEFIKNIKSLGFKVKLDSNGSNPEKLQRIIDQQLVDYIAMDVKTKPEAYCSLAGSKARSESILKSIELLKHHTVEYEFRTTLIKQVHSPEVLEEMCYQLQGARRLFLQYFQPGHTLSLKGRKYSAFSQDEMEEIARLFRNAIRFVEVR